ncbi:MAG: coniferyl aldehyde dehydrogenase [Betaproteobacteria bacterium]|nr:coniferyl aldehyde dehydrogenase [Betaproteobacteria bacterium]
MSEADPDAALAPLNALFSSQRAAFQRTSNRPAAARRADLSALERALKAHAYALMDAVYDDFGGRSPTETRVLEFFPSLEAIRHARRKVASWMRAERRPVSLWFLPGRARLVKQPLGVVGVIVPWNYPIYLALGPLVSALAAGNRVLIKMSEFTPRTGLAMQRMLAEAFPEDQVAVLNGGPEVAQALTALPLDHLLFTGSTAVGHKVMQAAAANLTPVTLELGGKSPAIIGPDFDLALAARRIMLGKCLNAGQTCIAPDYVLLPEGRELAFIEAARREVFGMYPRLAGNVDYSAIISPRHFERLQSLLDDARAKGADCLPLNPDALPPPAASRRLPPTLVTGVKDEMRIMQEEIFGPLLPLVPYRDFDAALAYVNERPRPLALYAFEDDPARRARVLGETISGGVTLNDVILHIAQDELPFGGVGPSGMGHYHGRAGFETFSKQKGVFQQTRWNTLPLLKPPYGKTVERLLRLMLR